ncbi:MAG: CDC48 family AAA ATPase [Promethearchaeota archaeon]
MEAETVSSNDKDQATAILRVAEARSRDAGRGFVRIDPKVVNKLGLKPGDVVELENFVRGIKTAGLVMPGYSEDEGTGVVRIDGSIRSNLKASIDERVRVRRIEAAKAERITIGFLGQRGVRFRDPQFLATDLLLGRVVTEGDVLSFVLMGQRVDLVVTDFRPRDAPAVIIQAYTKVTLEEKPVTEEIKGRRQARVSYEDIGGLDDAIHKVREMIELPMRHPEIFLRVGIQPPKGVLLYGPPGTGKTLLAKAVANETDAHFISISGPEIMSKFYGASEENLRNIFKEAQERAPSIIFIDEIDSIAPKREEVTGEVERRVVAQLLALMDGLESRGEVVVIAATNRPNSIDEALRRPGRFDREIEIGVPDKKGRLDILQIHTRGMPLAEDVDLAYLAEKTHGFVGADLAALTKEAAMSAVHRVLPEIKLDEAVPAEVLDKIKVTQQDFLNAFQEAEPSAIREVLITTPSETWDDIGGLENAKQQLQESVEWPLKYPNLFKHVNAKPPSGILLYGPPGTGKTLLAKALAHESEINFISVKGPEFLSKWVGESEKAVRETFRKARAVAPCIIFLDEIDAIAPVRGSGFGSSQVTERVISQLLTEMDGLEELKDVILIAATNRPDILDPALLRAGRFGRHIEIPLPDEAARRQIFQIHLRGKPLADDVDLEAYVKATEGRTGADIQALVQEATILAIRDAVLRDGIDDADESSVASVKLTKAHFDAALTKVTKEAVRSEQVYRKSKESAPSNLYG